jgi:hypothetical protein
MGGEVRLMLYHSIRIKEWAEKSAHLRYTTRLEVVSNTCIYTEQKTDE